MTWEGFPPLDGKYDILIVLTDGAGKLHFSNAQTVTNKAFIYVLDLK